MTSRTTRPSAWRRLRWGHPELSLLAVSVAAWLAVVILHLTMPSHGGAAHCSMVPQGAGHHHGTTRVDVVAEHCVGILSGAREFPESMALWVGMAAAMMLPTALPVARSIALNGRWNRRHRGQGLFAVGYLAVWSVFGAVVLAASWLAGPGTADALLVSALLATAAAWELTRRKRFFLRACHRVRALPADGWRADRACVGEGVRNGLQCTGACGPMMLAMALAPHALWLMVVLFGVVVGEKWVTRGVDHLRLFAAVLAVVAVIVAFGAPLG
ncbi:DUF2182 domain-containing protein [Mycobacterium sp. 48b]|uniref:DUF2182 domain-containing protein n=1 Tax=Mycobacterium sp. 48b TaxID=3400426 RepID=UPI003AAA7174